MTNSPSSLPTTTPATGVVNGISLIKSAREEPSKALISGDAS